MVYNPRGTRTRKERLNPVPSRIYPFAACAIGVVDDINVNLIYRSLACFAGQEFFLVGSQKWHKGATNGLEDILKIRHFGTLSGFLRFIKTERDYKLVSIEQSDKSVSMESIKQYPTPTCFIFGNEGFGLGDDALLQSDLIVEIPMDGFHPCLNVGVTSGIVFHDFVRKNG